jgi:hypothetical protein
MDLNKQIVGEILLEFAMIDSCLRSVYLMKTGDAPAERIAEKDLDQTFFEYIDNRTNAILNSKSKIYHDEEDKPIHLITILGEIRQTRNIAAHQTYELVTGLSAVPESARGKLVGSYIGTIDQLRDRWRLYSDQFLPIFELWNAGVLGIFDLDGTQIAEA